MEAKVDTSGQHLFKVVLCEGCASILRPFPSSCPSTPPLRHHEIPSCSVRLTRQQTPAPPASWSVLGRSEERIYLHGHKYTCGRTMWRHGRNMMHSVHQPAYLQAPTSTSLVEIMPAIIVAILDSTMARTRAKVKTKISDEEKEKSKARKSGPSWLNKGCQLGLKANVPMFAGYWEPTHHEWRVKVYRPRGWRPFDVNKVVGGMKWKTVIGTNKLCRSKMLRRHRSSLRFRSSLRSRSKITLKVHGIEPANRLRSENWPN